MAEGRSGREGAGLTDFGDFGVTYHTIIVFQNNVHIEFVFYDTAEVSCNGGP